MLSRALYLPTLALLVCGTVAHANTITFSAGNSSIGGTATFTTAANSLTIVLTSNNDNPTSAAQELSGITFTLGTAPTTDSLTSVTGNLINIANNGSYTSAGSETLANTHWGTSRSGADICLETAGSCAKGGQPEDLIIGTASSYPDLNASAINHNPSIQGSGTFVLALTGINVNTTISNVVFGFGTTPDSTIPATIDPPTSAAPEPSSLMLLGSGLSLSAGLLRRRKRS